MNHFGKSAFLFAHPDDETFLSACLIRQMADRGEAPVLLLATRGDAGGKNGYASHLSREQLGIVREGEMNDAAAILGLADVTQLGLPDGKLREADESAAIDEIVRFVNRHRPASLFTFPPDGGNGHPDHIAISQLTAAAVASGRCASVERLYYVYFASNATQGIAPDITIDTETGWPTKNAALRAHKSQWLAIERYFGPDAAFTEQRRYESFVIGWTADGGFRW